MDSQEITRMRVILIVCAKDKRSSSPFVLYVINKLESSVVVILDNI